MDRGSDQGSGRKDVAAALFGVSDEGGVGDDISGQNRRWVTEEVLDQGIGDRVVGLSSEFLRGQDRQDRGIRVGRFGQILLGLFGAAIEFDDPSGLATGDRKEFSECQFAGFADR